MNRARRPVIAGNWKMNKTASEAAQFCRDLKARLGDPLPSAPEVILFPPFTALPAVAHEMNGSAVAWGGQNLHWEESGAFTGEISGRFLAELGCRHVLVGHSERRALFGETDETCGRKVAAAVRSDLVPVLCCGESPVERDAGYTLSIIQAQLDTALMGSAEIPLIVAYEPVWAIGTGRNATPEQAQEVHAFIRQWLAGRFSPAFGAAARVLYGGSVKPDNVADLMAQPDVDGALVGGASLDLDSFVKL
ncbi:triose-phosphate isomerase, partial [candidate division WOR-3 bacterium]|nr:triose-phosphate isomerase [candidate division WOR-3 bacterium]